MSTREINSGAVHRPATHHIEVRGARVHNLKSIDVDVPINRLTVMTGVSGSGKSSLAFDTLYAEGQRRYIESFSSADRRHLELLEKPDADSIVRIPPAIALRQNAVARAASRRATVATVTELDDLLRVLFARTGTVVCSDCKVKVRKDSAESVAEWIQQLPSGTKLQIGFPLAQASVSDDSSGVRQEPDGQILSSLLESGFTRALVFNEADSNDFESTRQISGNMVSIQDLVKLPFDEATDAVSRAVTMVDRVVSGKTSQERILEAIETSFRESDGRCVVMAMLSEDSITDCHPVQAVLIDGDVWSLARFSASPECALCGRAYQSPEPAGLSFRSPLGACESCRGSGRARTFSIQELVPDGSLSLEAGAVAALEGERWKRERDRLLRFAANAGIPVDVAFDDLSSEQKKWLVSGNDSSAHNREGLTGLFDRLEKRTQHAATREFLGRWSQLEVCSACRGTRINANALAVRIGLRTDSSEPDSLLSIGDVSALTVDEALRFFVDPGSKAADDQCAVGRNIVTDLVARLTFLRSTGLGYLQLNREMASLSRGEAQRVALTSIAGTSLVNTLFVIDEPSAGLHARDVERVVDLIRCLRDAGNTVVVVEHEADFLAAADHLLDIGPGAGQHGGTLVYSGEPQGLAEIEESATGRWISETLSNGTESCSAESGGRTQEHSRTRWLRLRGATCHTVKNCSIDIPLGQLCVITGVSGAGKSSLIEKVLYPAVCQALEVNCSIDDAGDYMELTGAESLSSVELIDDLPLAGSRRSNPATWLKVFDEIRKLFAETDDARRRQLTASHFSFNTDSGGRCSKCEGTGRVQIDMQFLADVSMTCPDCSGTRYLPHILEVQWRARTIADVLAMTAAEAFSFFRGQSKIQKRLRALKDVGLDYLTLGQPLSTLSGGESQRMKLASCLSTSRRTGSLLILNEPTTGLHPADVERLLECLEGLISVGHSLVVIEHHLDVIRRADHIIDMGPEAGPGGGQIVASGSVAQIAACPDSLTGRYLRSTGVSS